MRCTRSIRIFLIIIEINSGKPKGEIVRKQTATRDRSNVRGK